MWLWIKVAYFLQFPRLLAVPCLILTGVWFADLWGCKTLEKDHYQRNYSDTYFALRSKSNQIVNWTQAGPTVVGYPDPYNALCSFELCKLINPGRTPVKYIRRDPRAVCRALHQCVTLITKTRYRLSNVVNLITSFHKYYPGTKVIIVDDFNPSYPTEAPDAWLRLYDKGKDGLITYIQAEEGISHGRNIALHLATTEYVLFVDDDHVFTDASNVSVLLHVLQYTDATVAGGQFGNYRFDGLARAITIKSNAHLIWYPYIFYQTLQPFADCYVTDRVHNVFMAKRQDLLDTGGWDKKRKINEHTDFFLTLRTKHKKIVYCPKITFYHNISNDVLHFTRRDKNVTKMYEKMLEEKWQFSETYWCKPSTYFVSDHCGTRMDLPWQNDTIWKIWKEEHSRAMKNKDNSSTALETAYENVHLFRQWRHEQLRQTKNSENSSTVLETRMALP